MSTTEKSRPLMAQETGQAETAALAGMAVPYPYSTSDATTGQQAIADFLGRSKETALTGRELCAALDVDSRTLRQRIEAERRAGTLIVADNASGYWLTNDPGEAAQFVRSMRGRAQQILATADAIERAAGLPRRESQPLDGQEALF